MSQAPLWHAIDMGDTRATDTGTVSVAVFRPRRPSRKQRARARMFTLRLLRVAARRSGQYHPHAFTRGTIERGHWEWTPDAGMTFATEPGFADKARRS